MSDLITPALVRLAVNLGGEKHDVVITDVATA
jgi:hypothetical protein